RDSVWTLHSSGANRFYMQAVDDRAMNEWVRAVRLGCFEAAKLYEYYTAALINERYANILSAQRPSEYHVHVRFSGTNDWVPCAMVLSGNPAQITFCSEETQAQIAAVKSPRYSYSIYPDSIDKVDSAMIAKFEGDCDVDSSLLPNLEDTDGERDVAPLNSRDHGSYALVIFQSAVDMASALVEVAAHGRMYNMPSSFAPDFIPERQNLYLSLPDIADKSIEIMEPVTARRMLENLASERCPKTSTMSSGQSVDYWASASAGNTNSAATVAETQLPWGSDASDEEPEIPIAVNKKRESIVQAAGKILGSKTAKSEPEAVSEPEQQKRGFRFLQKSGKSKDDSKRDSSILPKETAAANANAGAKHIKRQSKSSSNSTTTSNKDSHHAPTSESLSHASTAPSLPTPVSSTAMHGTFGDDAAEAIGNLKIVDSLLPGSEQQSSLPVPRQLADSDTDSDGDAPLGNIIPRLAQSMGAASGMTMLQQQQQQNILQQQHMQMQMQMQMHRASAAIPGMVGPAQMMAMQQQQNMMQNPQSMYGAMPNVNMAQMFAQDPNQMMMAGGGMPVPFQGAATMRGRPNTFMDPAAAMWGQQQGGMGMGMGMDSVGGPLLTVDKKADPIERPTGLVGAIANREQMKSEQKYRDSSSLMKERQMRRNQAMGMNNQVFSQQPGARFGAGGQAYPNMYGAQQGWGDDAMSMMSGISGRAPYAQVAPSLSAEQLSGGPMRGTMFGIQQPLSAQIGGMSNDEDDVALSVYAGGRMSVAAPDVHPLRAAMQSGMSLSTPQLVGGINPYAQQQQQMQMQMQMQILQQQQQIQQMQHQLQPPNAFSQNHQRQLSAGGSVSAPAVLPHSNTMPAGNSRHSLVSSNSGSGSGSSGNSSSLAIQNRLPASRWVKEAPNARADFKSSTMPRTHGASSNGNSRTNSSSIYALPGRSSAVRIAEPVKTATRTQAYNARYTSEDDDDSEEEESEDEYSYGGYGKDKMSKELKQFFNAFADKCLDIKPYAWVDFTVAFDAYKSFCSRNGMSGKDVATSSQFQDLMGTAEWQLKTRDTGVRAYYNTCLI
ncbi:hypothetical protein LPJ66_002268, partial [Kickxella alabastrina]